MNIEIANKLVGLRKEKGLSQEELANKIGISRQAVSKWERAESSPDTENLIALAKLYDISLDELLLKSVGKAGDSNTAAIDTGSHPQTSRYIEEDNKRKGGMFLFPYPIVTVILFFVFIFTNTGWGFAWLIFLTIPIYYSIAEMIYQNKGKSGKNEQ